MADTWWSMICLAGLWGFVLGTVVLILKSFPARGCFDRASALKWGVLVVLCFTVWMVGMTQA